MANKLDKVADELQRKAHNQVASKTKWKNRDFNSTFDREVDDEYTKLVKAYVKDHPDSKSFFYESVSKSMCGTLIESIRKHDWHSATEQFVAVMQEKAHKRLNEERRRLSNRTPNGTVIKEEFKVKCMECGRKFKASSIDAKCPKCGSHDLESESRKVSGKLVEGKTGKCVECGRKGMAIDDEGLCHECWQDRKDKEKDLDEGKTGKDNPYGSNKFKGKLKEDEEDGPEEDDVTCDDSDGPFYCNRKKVANNVKELKAWMKREKYYPNVWVISDHGNAELVELD